jgi:hypothetical protein
MDNIRCPPVDAPRGTWYERIVEDSKLCVFTEEPSGEEVIEDCLEGFSTASERRPAPSSATPLKSRT